jgi:hypothetical protein
MRISTEDRIEAARLLRSFSCDGSSCDKCTELSEELFGRKGAICDFDVSFEKIADLIDRPTTTRHGKFKTKYGRQTPCCEVCGYSIGDMRWNYCPKCGAVITDD